MQYFVNRTNRLKTFKKIAQVHGGGSFIASPVATEVLPMLDLLVMALA